MDFMEQAREWIHAANSVVVFTGAGISAESGVPTFRGPGGYWRTFKPEDLATPGAFQRDPKLVWEWYDWRRQRIAEAQPNAGHLALVELEERKPRFTLVTQNVDGLHDRAGSRNVFKLHGDIWWMKCSSCRLRWRDDRVAIFDLPPRCSCGALARPDVVWFGENVPKEPYRAAEEAILQAQVFLSIGTSAQVVPASNLISLAKWAGAKVIELNLEETWISDKIDASLRGKAAELLPQLIS
jgi:NAD-dependent deacetylase